MKNLIVAGIICSFFLGLAGCSENETVLEEVFKSGGYDSEEAIKRGDVVFTALGNHNVETFEQFLSNVSNKKEDTIRITHYTHEGDPIFHDLEFDGEVFHYSYDNSYDKNGQPAKEEDVCKEIKTEDLDDKQRVAFLISNCSVIDDHYLIEIRKNQLTYE